MYSEINVKWLLWKSSRKAVGVLNASEPEPTEALQGSGVTSDGELLLLLPFRSLVKLQRLRLEAPSEALAPKALRLFANAPNLDMDDAMTGEATQEFAEITWTALADGVSTTLELNFLKFQKLSFLAIYAQNEDHVGLRKLSLTGRS